MLSSQAFREMSSQEQFQGFSSSCNSTTLSMCSKRPMYGNIFKRFPLRSSWREVSLETWLTEKRSPQRSLGGRFVRERSASRTDCDRVLWEPSAGPPGSPCGVDMWDMQGEEGRLDA
ncbi:hypothetical protein SKAU_G00241430 [Synaphobranchus kaupii]|uniref:Uncharacterized protein n=1 Tax=Synaphobranchus kaupii TaxID=118154 RepID=A0A9Q1F7J5_SYNKA|nr:hypothetical protein SKAU_G00241430 [Synaphobranchus kaupii]